MLFNHRYPYTDFHELNLDWILCKMRELDSTLTEFTTLNKLQWCGTWDISKSYSAWSLVEDGDGNGYVSTGPVPSGIQLTNADYWQKVANYSSLYAAFEQRIELLEDGEAELKTQLQAEAEARKTGDVELTEKIGYVQTTPAGFGVKLQKQIWTGGNYSFTLNGSTQGATYDSKRQQLYMGVYTGTSTANILVFDKTLTYVKTITLTLAEHCSDLDYIDDTDEVYLLDGVRSEIRVYDPETWSLKRVMSTNDPYPDTAIQGITHNGNTLYYYKWFNSPFLFRYFKSNLDLTSPEYLTDLASETDVFDFTMYPGIVSEEISPDNYVLTGGIQYYNGEIYGFGYFQQHQNVNTNPVRIFAYNPNTNKVTSSSDFTCCVYDETENMFTIDNALYSSSWCSDWTGGSDDINKAVILSFRRISPNIHSFANEFKPKLFSGTVDEINSSTAKSASIKHIPGGRYLIILNTNEVPYAANRVCRCRLFSGNTETVFMSKYTHDYMQGGFNASMIVEKHSPLSVSVEFLTSGSTTYSMEYYIRIIPLTDTYA
jgi:hypothetical protein